MLGSVVNTNVANISGSIASDFEFSHEIYGEQFYNFFIDVPRLSNTCDRLPVMVSERLLDGININIESRVAITGQIRSYNRVNSDGKGHLLLSIFCKDIKNSTEEDKIKNPNDIFLDGYLCKKPIYRTTPFGREICDILLAVNRMYNKSDYIPCIAWGRNARFCERLSVGTHVRIWGRFQSREYQKRLDDENVITRIAYEVSISKMEKLD
ncbi:single-stranded DNA-binding protein [Calorimonas adulescens]|uniref:Single-stranded DNA-binding protein n=1 Tax=Calorimonas adulescens TaxID=2606906 RepID=A0A5D8QB58_9THEO|nr:single-stranded DNA-binding protein [Calorimonas adulescens]TZE81751.1 single-stranded DNA-binding protein [Calorimonas adulescens]